MNIEIIKRLKERAKEMLEDNYDRKIGVEGVYTIICELENFYTAYEKEKGENVKLRLQDIPLMEGELKAYKDRVNELKQGLEKEKEKNKELKWKPIKDYDRKKYDWVLVKYFDGDYECVPEVAERRNDGKWYTSERQIPFEVKYFFDMQEILKEE